MHGKVLDVDDTVILPMQGNIDILTMATPIRNKIYFAKPLRWRTCTGFGVFFETPVPGPLTIRHAYAMSQLLL